MEKFENMWYLKFNSEDQINSLKNSEFYSKTKCYHHMQLWVKIHIRSIQFPPVWQLRSCYKCYRYMINCLAWYVIRNIIYHAAKSCWKKKSFRLRVKFRLRGFFFRFFSILKSLHEIKVKFWNQWVFQQLRTCQFWPHLPL